jgi:hypothetical protein
MSERPIALPRSCPVVVWILLGVFLNLGTDVRADQIATTSEADAPNTETRFTLVLIDAETEASLGEFPYSRRVYADAIVQLQKYEARATALKFFLDQARDEEGDRALEEAMAKAKMPVLLQARLSNDEASTDNLDPRFAMEPPVAPPATPLGGERGWMPLRRLQNHASSVGFVDIDQPFRVPVVEMLGTRVVKSLQLALLEAAYSSRAKWLDRHTLAIGRYALPVGNDGQLPISVPKESRLESISLIRVLRGNAKAEMLRNRVVVLAYDGTKMPMIATPSGDFRADRLFWHGLLSMEKTLCAHPATLPATTR